MNLDLHENNIKQLEELILKHKILYYAGKAEISDEEYDKLEDQLKKLSPHNSILSYVGAPASGNKIKHDKKMLSLSKVYSIEELEKWANEKELVSTIKLDGTSCSLVYKNGLLSVAKTRGDGEYGEDILDKVVYVKSIPKKIMALETLEIRGEIYCDEQSFLGLTDEMVKRNLEKPKSQRNIVSGIIGRKEEIDLASWFSFKAFDCLSGVQKFESEIEKLNYLKNLKFDVPVFNVVKNKNEIIKAIEQTKYLQDEGEILLDGIVFTFNDVKTHDELGETNHHPKYKMAFKFAGETKTAEIKSIVWSVSRSGTITPVAEIEPVELSGALISRVTLHNFGLVKEFGLKSGDTIQIIRSGEVIPKFLSVVTSGAGLFEYPLECPSCGHKTIIETIRLKCINNECPGRKKEEILNYIEKIGIEDLSEKRLAGLLEKKMVNSIEDIYTLTTDKLMLVEKIKDKLASKIISSIEKSKKISLIKLLSALNISGGGEGRLEKIVNSGFNTIEKILELTEVELLKVDGVGELLAKDFILSINNKKSLILKLIDLGLTVEAEKSLSDILKGKKFCITGTLSRKREEIEGLIKAHEGIVSSGVTKETSYLITNETDSNSSKFIKAKKLNIMIITEEEFIKMME